VNDDQKKLENQSLETKIPELETRSTSNENSQQGETAPSNHEVKRSSSEAEDIRQLLDGPTSTKSGTVTFTKSPTSSPQPKKSKKASPWRVVGVFLLLIALLGVGSLFYIRQQLSPVSAVSAPVEFEVEPGWGAAQVASELRGAGLIRNARIFSFYLRRQNLDRNIGEGLYDLDPAMSSATIATALNQGGRPRVVRVVIPEGFRMKDIAESLARAGLGDAKSWLALFDNPSQKPIFVGADMPLEGYLFPASYEIPVRSTPEEVIQIFLDRFAQELTPDMMQALGERGWTIPGWVTLASIVQAEAANASEMPIIAGVFINRLEDGMLLQSDPTVAYGLGKDLPELDYGAGDFQQDNAWNTYVRPGLPETPINNPGSEALQAVLNPQRENEAGQRYLYFLHGNDEGQPVFRPNLTLQDHERDVELYLR
jgi:UPF0755 protein